jgi:hypothetical protein
MTGYIVGGLMLIVGLVLVLGAFPFVRYAGRLWPAPHTRGSVDSLVSGSFLGRFIGIAMVLAGAGVILFEAMSG